MTSPEGLDPIYDAARIRLGTAIRRLGHAAIGHESTIDDMELAAQELERIAEALEADPKRVRDLSHFGKSLQVEAKDGERLNSHLARPGSGSGSPHGLDMTVHRHGDRIHARFTFGSADEGPPQRAHGGMVALAFDDALGFVLNMHQIIAYTGRLSISYKAGSPLGTPLAITAWMENREGRKLFIESELREDRPDAPLIATCSAIFIEMTDHPGLSGTIS